ncbi:DNA polymerase IV 3 domain protein [Mycobacterium xenopi 4042]|uniref:DNA polymerase IV 3 domain protein n=1 Tax=Mycobacterium xenopi 4042 TaxID=1299334 RepID=X7Z4F5_MYCXE|nr:DNA polymerase IV 3 domain protein [Mycobacterium xenopi 4042]EUA33865.1 DNA polymerase IV 3 domain protein [Mycobacterium xenopi 3993]
MAQQALADVVAQSRIVTRVAVTVRTSTFYTRTKIRKLDAPSTDPASSSPPRCGCSTCSSWTGRSGCWVCAWNCRCRRDFTAAAPTAAAPG